MKVHTGYLASYGLERILERRTAIDFADTLSSTALTSFDHDGPADRLGFLQTLLDGGYTGVLIRAVWDGDEALLGQLSIGDARSGPRHCGDVGGLSDDGRRDLVSKRTHSGARWADEDDLVLGSGERFW